MAIKTYKSSAWQDIGTLKVPVSGAYQTASGAKALVSSAWTTVWNSAVYFLKDGVLMNGATASGGDGIYHPTTEDGYLVYKNAYPYSNTNAYFYIPTDATLVGKTLYVVSYSNYCSPTILGGGYFGSSGSSNIHTYSNLPSTTDKNYTIWFNVSGYSTESIKDIYIA